MFTTCKNIRAGISAFLDDELDEKQRDQIIRHVQRCPDCTDFLESLRQNNLRLDGYLSFRKSRIPGPSVQLPVIDEGNISGKSIEKEPKEISSYSSNVLNRLMSMKENLLELFGLSGQRDFAEISADGTITTRLSARLIPAILLALAIILLYAPKLEAI